MSNTFIVWNLVAGIQSLHADTVRAAVSVLTAAKWSPIARLSRTQNKCLPKLKQKHLHMLHPKYSFGTSTLRRYLSGVEVHRVHEECSSQSTRAGASYELFVSHGHVPPSCEGMFQLQKQESVGKQWRCEVGFLQTQTFKSFHCKLEKSPQCNPKGFFISSCYHCLFSWRFLPWALVLGPLHWAQQGQRRECLGGRISDFGDIFLGFFLYRIQPWISQIISNNIIIIKSTQNFKFLFSDWGLALIVVTFHLSEACGGGVIGGLVGLVPAVFTFGLSIPIGAMLQAVFRRLRGHVFHFFYSWLNLLGWKDDVVYSRVRGNVGFTCKTRSKRDGGSPKTR